MHASIRSTSSASLGMPGVHAVLTHQDLPGQKHYGLEFPDQPVLAIDRVRYFGEPVALVAAEHPEQARRAAERIAVEYEPLELVVDPERATEQEPLHPERPTSGHGYRDDPRPNVIRSIVVRHGDPEAEADVAVSGRYEVGIQDQAFLGPESGLAVPDGQGGVDVYVATQWLHVDRDQVAPCLGLAPEQVRLHLAGVGGAFGGREDLSMQIHGALLALRTGRPVKVVYNREESFTGHVHRHPARIWAEHRATREGRLVCVRMRILLDGGAYASSSTAVIANACAFACGPYRVDNVLIEGTCVYSNNPPCGAMRGFGAVQSCFAHEAQMDRLADDSRDRSDRAAPSQRACAGRCAANRPADHWLLPRGRGDSPLRCARAARARGTAAGCDSASRGLRQHDPGRGRASKRRVCGRLQESLLLGGVRRLLRRASAPSRRGCGPAVGRDPLCRRRGRAGCDRRDASGGEDRARHRRRHDRATFDGERRVGRLDVGVADDVDGGRRRAARLSCRARGVGGHRHRRCDATSTSSASIAIRARGRSIPSPDRSRPGLRTSPSPVPR